MIPIHRIVLAVALVAPPLSAQQTVRVVDPYGYTGYTTITSAALVSASGDTILIKEFRTTGGELTGYSETHDGGGETFPIVIPSGVTVKPTGTDQQVLIWSTSAGNSNPLFRLEGAAATAPQTRVEDLGFFAGAPAIDIPGTTGVETRAVIARCDFSRNSIAISALASDDHHHYLTIRDCRLLDYEVPPPDPVPPNGLPGYQPPAIGFRFHAISEMQSTAPGQIDVLVDNLATAGLFDFIGDMAKPGYSFVNGNFGPNPDAFSRVIEVYSEGNGDWLEHSSPTSPISEVRLLLQSSNLKGEATTSVITRGWDVGVLAVTGTPPFPGGTDYTAGFQVQVVGTTIDGFRDNGIYSTSTSWTRGTIKVQGNSVIKNTGAHTGHNLGDRNNSGVHCAVEDGCYMQLDCSGSSFSNNTGSGISLRSNSVRFNTTFVPPLGSFLSLENCNLHQNAASGLRIEAGTGLGGGAHHFIPEPGFPTQRIPNLHQSAATSVFSVPSGQGLVNRCNISNSGEAGIHLLAQGTFNNITGLSTRFVNCMVWNNLIGGVFAQLDGTGSSPYMLTPFLHCTFAANGDPSTPNWNQSLRIVEEDRANGDKGIYLWELSIPGIGDFELSTKVFNSIFDRGSPGLEDFDLVTVQDILVGDDISPSVPSDKVGVIGCRYFLSSGTSYPVSTSNVPPFKEYGNWISLDPSILYLLTNINGFDTTADYVMQLFQEANFDHPGTARPSYSNGLRDKGAMEFN